MSSFEDRKKNFENKFALDEELKFKVNSKRNKYLGEWAAEILGKKDEDKEQYILDVIKSDFSEPGDEDIIKNFVQILSKYQISIDQIINAEYVEKFSENEKIDIFTMANKIINGFNENEVKIVSQKYKKKGFFERFFDLFS